MATTSIAASKFAENQSETDILTAVLNSLPSFLEGAVIADVASIAAGAEATQAVTVPGAAVGDYAVATVVDAAPTTGSLADCVMQARVSAADTVTVTITNVHAATALDLSATARFNVLVIETPIPSPSGKTLTA